MGWVKVALLAVLAPVGVAAQDDRSDRKLEGEVRALVDAEIARGGFSGVVLLARADTVIAPVAGGSANSERGTAVTPDTRFNLASGDKLFTKIAVLQLVQRGRLLLTDTVGRLLPDYGNATVRQNVTVEQLLRHRGGLGSYWNDAFLRNRTRLENLADLIPLFENDPLAFEPGSRMRIRTAAT